MDSARFSRLLDIDSRLLDIVSRLLDIVLTTSILSRLWSLPRLTDQYTHTHFQQYQLICVVSRVTLYLLAFNYRLPWTFRHFVEMVEKL